MSQVNVLQNKTRLMVSIALLNNKRSKNSESANNCLLYHKLICCFSLFFSLYAFQCKHFSVGSFCEKFLMHVYLVYGRLLVIVALLCLHAELIKFFCC